MVQNIPGVGLGHNPSCVPSQPLAQPQPAPRLSAVRALLTNSQNIHVGNTGLAPNPRHTTLLCWAAVENGPSIPVRPRAALQGDRVYAKMPCSPRGRSKDSDAHGHQEALLNPGIPRQVVGDLPISRSWRYQTWDLHCECPTDCPAQPWSAPPEKKVYPAPTARNAALNGDFLCKRKTEANTQVLMPGH